MTVGFNDDNLTKRLLETGWQSWSYESYYASYPIQIPSCIYPPKKYEILPKIEIESIKLKKPATGWCSWYSYGWEISEAKIMRNAQWISENKQIPLEYVLIDAGWCLWGDWLIDNPKRFPDGLKSTVKKIHNLGLKAGVWVGPLMVHPNSKIAKQHPEWLVKENGHFVDGFRLTSFDRFFPYKKYILDIKNVEVQNYINESIVRLVEEVGVDMLKFDFMYAIYHDPKLSIDEADKFIHEFYLKVKEKYPHVYTIACGSPLIPSLGVVDSIRLSSDTVVSPFVKFFPLASLFDGFYIHGKVMKSLRERIWTKKYWNIDPDALVCRNGVGLSDKQISDHATIIKEGMGNIFLGDNLTILSKEKINKFIIPLFQK